MGCISTKKKSITISVQEETNDEPPLRRVRTPTVIIERRDSPMVNDFEIDQQKDCQTNPSLNQLFIVEEMNSNLEESPASSPIHGVHRVFSTDFNFLKENPKTVETEENIDGTMEEFKLIN